MHTSTSEKTAAFKATRLTSTVFKLVEYSDIYSEHPFIYVKVLLDVIVIIDTGCGGSSTESDIEVTSLREFIETIPVKDNDDNPLNQGARRKYAIICTHYHYDHILGLDQFSRDSPIYASSYSPTFLSPENLPHNSLCQRLGIQTPEYTPTLIDHLSLVLYKKLEDLNSTTSTSFDTGLQILHTPGHTPDELAVWDKSEKMLYVGDTLYEWAPIIFPPEGNLKQWFNSVDLLINFVKQFHGEDNIKLNAGHESSMQDALDVLGRGREFLMDVVCDREEEKDQVTIDGVVYVIYSQSGGRFSLRCPLTLIEDARLGLAGRLY